VKLSVIIPCYNEHQTIEEMVKQVEAVGLAHEIIIVDDGSTDGTRDVLGRLNGHAQLHILYHPANRGTGAAVITGIRQAQGEVIMIQDADMEYDPRDTPMLIRPILEGRAAVVYGSRFRGGPNKAMMFWHMVANKMLTLATNLLYNTILTDMETGYKVFRADVIKNIPLHSRRFDFEPEVTAKILKRGHHIVEVPISYYGREYEEGKKIRFRDAPIALWTLIKYRFMD
jgi:glycosyltransferase involved in cell wall biosynthesis